MPYRTISTHDYSGLDLVSAGDEAGCVDLLNVDFDRRGAVRARDGYDNFTSGAGAARYTLAAPFYPSTGSRRLLAVRGSTVEALDTAGASVTTQALLSSRTHSLVRFAAPNNEYMYVGSGAAVGEQKGILGVQPVDNRLALSQCADLYRWNGAAGTFTSVAPPGSTYISRVYFSDAGAPETFGANNYVELYPGDGEFIQQLVTFREMLIAFKETRYFVFYGNSVDSAGNPIFNYRAISASAGMVSPRGYAVAPEGVYFCSRDGIYLTTGGGPRRISDSIEPLFTGAVTSFFASSAINRGQMSLIAMTYLNGRLYVAYPSGSATANDRTLVYDTRTERWTLWTTPAAALSTFRIGDADELVFAYASGSNHVGRHSSSYTDDDGTAIVSRYRTGFSNLGDDDEKSVAQAELWGTGTVNYQLSKDFGSLDTATSVAMGTSPAIARGRPAQRGGEPATLFSWQVGASSGQWTLHRAVHRLHPGGKSPGSKTP